MAITNASPNDGLAAQDEELLIVNEKNMCLDTANVNNPEIEAKKDKKK